MPSLLIPPINTLMVEEAEGIIMANELIKHFEGFRSEAYQDSAGIWTIGYGHTKGVKKGDKITKEEGDKFLDDDLEDARLRVARAIMGKDLGLNTNEFEALVSLAYNLRSFEQLANHLPDKNKFKKKMLLYCKDVKGNYLKGLKIRRIAERLLFEGREWAELAKELQGKTLDDVKKAEAELFA